MSDAENRALGRAAALLLLASVLRWGWDAVRPVSPGPSGPDRAADLLSKSRALESDQRERDRPLGGGERIDPNRASASEIDRLPGVGPATARAVVASRERDGPFVRPEDLLRVRGLGEGTLARIREHLAFPTGAAGVGRLRRKTGPPARAKPPERAPPRAARLSSGPVTSASRVDVNRAGVEELQALPGIGPALARRIVQARAERPFSSPDDLTRVSGIGPATLKRLRDRITAGR